MLHGIESRQATWKRHQRIVEARDQGQTFVQIAKREGLSSYYVGQIFKRAARLRERDRWISPVDHALGILEICSRSAQLDEQTLNQAARRGGTNWDYVKKVAALTEAEVRALNRLI
jgi:lambda repressor-like predicted transcriptional regulator